MTDAVRDKQLVTAARELERLMAKRRKRLRALAETDDEIRIARKLLRDLTAPDPSEVYRPAADGEPIE